jgi:hypothetical protein
VRLLDLINDFKLAVTRALFLVPLFKPADEVVAHPEIQRKAEMHFEWIGRRQLGLWLKSDLVGRRDAQQFAQTDTLGYINGFLHRTIN